MNDEYDFNRIDLDIKLAYISNNLYNFGLNYKERKLALGLVNYAYCPNSLIDIRKIFKHLPDNNSINFKIENSIKKLPWMSKMPKNYKKPQCGACYGLLHHTCPNKLCEICNGKGYRISPCKNCATIKHECSLCSSGFIIITDENNIYRRILCPNIKPSKKCSQCHGTSFGYKKKCYGICPLLHYSTYNYYTDKLLLGCACGRSHQIGDCKNLINTNTGKNIKYSPYQYWINCKFCGHTHPIIKSYQYKPNFIPKRKKIVHHR